MGKMPVVFVGSPDIAHRILSADPAEKKLFILDYNAEGAQMVTPYQCLYSKLAEHQIKKSCSRMKQRDWLEISSKVFSCVYTEEEHPVPVGYSILPCPGTADAMGPAEP